MMKLKSQINNKGALISTPILTIVNSPSPSSHTIDDLGVRIFKRTTPGKDGLEEYIAAGPMQNLHMDQPCKLKLFRKGLASTTMDHLPKEDWKYLQSADNYYNDLSGRLSRSSAQLSQLTTENSDDDSSDENRFKGEKLKSRSVK